MSEAGTVGDLLGHGAELLRSSGVDSPRLSCELLLAHVLGCSRLHVLTSRIEPVPDDARAVFSDILSRRAGGEPVAYLTGQKEFYGLTLEVGPGVLVPRPETELLVDQAGEAFDVRRRLRFADLGTGSGALAVALAVEFPEARGVAMDLSSEALAVAGRNVRRHGVEERVSLVRGDFTVPLPVCDLDLIVMNPPYVTEAEYASLSREVTDFEPCTALVSGPDGLDHIQAALPHVHQALRPGGVLLLEIGYEQGKRVTDLLERGEQVWERVRVLSDLAGLDRVVGAFRCK